ncbi:MAG: hypothetical protein AAF317_06850 [Pseudomonadota bacterium]
MADDHQQRIERLEADLALLKSAFLETMSDPPLTRSDRDLMVAEILAALERDPAPGSTGNG